MKKEIYNSILNMLPSNMEIQIEDEKYSGVMLTSVKGCRIYKGAKRFNGEQVECDIYFEDRISAITFVTGGEVNDNIIISENGASLGTIKSVYTDSNAITNIKNRHDNEVEEGNFNDKLLKYIKELKQPISLSSDSIQGICTGIKQALEKPQYTPHNWESKAGKVKDIYNVDIEQLKKLLFEKGALLIKGVPGTGKTTAMMKLISEVCNSNPIDKNTYKIVSFGQSTDYSDFIGGLENSDGVWKHKDGIFTEMCYKAYHDSENNYVIGIDEFSRGETERILGEALTAIELRGIKIATSGGSDILVPDNLFIVATMNSFDESTKELDEATQQRFNIYTIKPNWKNNDAYLQNLSHGDTSLLEKLRLISREMAGYTDTFGNIILGVNDIISNIYIEEDECGIGTRAISIPNMDSIKLKNAVEHQLIGQINRSTKNCTDKQKRDIEEKINNLRNIVNGY